MSSKGYMEQCKLRVWQECAIDAIMACSSSMPNVDMTCVKTCSSQLHSMNTTTHGICDLPERTQSS